jgi:hypothetical protein
LNTSTWTRIHRSSPIALATGDLDGDGKSEVIASFAKAGLWVRYNNSASWTRLHLYTPSNFFAGDLDGSGEDELVVDFGDSGLWARFNDASWQKLHSASPSEATAADLDGNGEVEAVVSFGKAGLWAWYNNANWRKVSGARVQIIQAGTFKTSNSSPAPTASLTSDPTVIDLGDSSTLVWQSADADSCTGVGFSTGGSANGSVMVSPTADASYSVSCTGEGGTANASATVSVNQPPSPTAPTASLTADPTVIDLGDSSALAWQSTDADSCTGVGFSTGGGANGSVTVSPTADASYSVSCTGEGGTASASATVSVNQPPPGEQVWPNADNTGVPAGWQPAQTLNSTLTISQNGAVVQDIRITTGDLRIQADNVTVRRVELLDGRITNDSCHDNLLIEDTSVMGHTSSEGAISPGSYTARRVRLDGVPEGFRVGAKPACGAVWVEDSFVHVTPPSPCGDWHGDGLQGYGGPPLVIRNVTIDFQEGGGCYGTAPFFYPADQGNTSVDVDRLIVRGGGFSFRLGMPGRVRNLRVVNRSWGYGPIEVNCSALSDWSAEIVTIDSDYQPTGTVSNLACN